MFSYKMTLLISSAYQQQSKFQAMARQRSILSLILVLVASFLISCSSPTVAKVPETYSPEQIQRIQAYLPKIVDVRDRAPELADLIQKRDWIFVGNFIHGPMAELRLAMNYVTSNLLSKDQPTGRKLTRELFDDLVKIDKAAADGSYQQATSYYKAALEDIDAFLQLVPQASSES